MHYFFMDTLPFGIADYLTSVTMDEVQYIMFSRLPERFRGSSVCLMFFVLLVDYLSLFLVKVVSRAITLYFALISFCMSCILA